MNRFTYLEGYRPVIPLVGQIWKTPSGGEIIVTRNKRNKYIRFQWVLLQSPSLEAIQSIDNFLEDFSRQ